MKKKTYSITVDVSKLSNIHTHHTQVADSLVQIDQEGDNIKAHFDKAFACVKGHLSSVHNFRGVI